MCGDSAIGATQLNRRGGDPCLGPRLLGLLGEAGLEQLQLEVVLPAFHEGEGKDIARITLEHIRESVVSADDAGGQRPHLWMGGVRLLVRSEDAERASKILTPSK